VWSDIASTKEAVGARIALMTDATIVRSGRIERVTPVRTIAWDEWRAAIALSGELDVANAGELREELATHLGAGRRVIRVDAGDVEFIDSTALGELVEASRQCAAGHGSLILTNVPVRIRRLLGVTGLDRVLLVDTAGLGQAATA
jgi:anti-sigma B factor antagonist